MSFWGISSAGQSACLASRRSSVRFRYSPPLQNTCFAQIKICSASMVRAPHEVQSRKASPRVVQQMRCKTDDKVLNTYNNQEMQLSWLEHHPDKVGVGGSSPLISTIMHQNRNTLVLVFLLILIIVFFDKYIKYDIYSIYNHKYTQNN